jgi:hypothetical protein
VAMWRMGPRLASYMSTMRAAEVEAALQTCGSSTMVRE